MQYQLTINEDETCSRCHGIGHYASDTLDADGLWFLDDECPECLGSGIEHCSAPDCDRPATRTVHAGTCWRPCCDCKACCTAVCLEIINQVLPL